MNENMFSFTFLCKFSCICNFAIFVQFFIKFSPKCKTKKLKWYTLFSGSFCSFLNWEGADIRPQIRPRKSPGRLLQDHMHMRRLVWAFTTSLLASAISTKIWFAGPSGWNSALKGYSIHSPRHKYSRHSKILNTFHSMFSTKMKLRNSYQDSKSCSCLFLLFADFLQN